MGDAIKHGFGVPDNGLLKLGDDSDGVLLLRSAVLGADTALGSVLVGTVESQAIAGNSVMVSNTTTDGDIALYTSKGGNSQMGLWLDGSAGDAALMASSSASVDHYIAGTKVLDHSAGAFAFQEATTISSTGAITINGVTSVVFNETGADVDFRIEGVGNANAFFVQGSNGFVGIGTAIPGRTLTVYGETAEGQIRTGTSDDYYWEIGRENTSTGRFMFKNYTSPGPIVELVSILISGSVGIGTPTPGALLDLDRPNFASNVETVTFLSSATTQTITGAVASAIFNQFLQNTITAATAQTVTQAATVYIQGATIAAGVGPAAITNNYAFWVDAGTSRFDGDIGQTANRVPMIYTTSQTTTNAETVDSWGMTKKNVTPYDDALTVLRGMKVRAYEHETTFDPSGRRKLGVLAESIAERMVTPFGEYVGLGQGPRLDMLGLAAINTRAIQQVDDEVETLRARVAFLESRLKFLEVPNATDPD